MKIKIDMIDADPNDNVRREIRTEELSNLIESILQDGLLQPLVVCQRGDRWRLVCGFRRLEAVKFLGWEEVPVTVVDDDSEESFLRKNFAENLIRNDLSPLEEAIRMEQLFPQSQNTIKNVALALGKSGTWVNRRRKLLRLPPSVQEKFHTREIGIEKIYSLTRHDDPAQAAKIIEGNIGKSRRDCLPVHRQQKRTKSDIRKMLTFMSQNGILDLPFESLVWAWGGLSDEVLKARIIEYNKGKTNV